MKDILRILNLEDNENDAELNGAMLSARWPQCQLVRVDNRQDYLVALELQSRRRTVGSYHPFGLHHARL